MVHRRARVPGRARRGKGQPDAAGRRAHLPDPRPAALRRPGGAVHPRPLTADRRRGRPDRSPGQRLRVARIRLIASARDLASLWKIPRTAEVTVLAPGFWM